jgi:hypothetical protein
VIVRFNASSVRRIASILLTIVKGDVIVPKSKTEARAARFR